MATSAWVSVIGTPEFYLNDPYRCILASNTASGPLLLRTFRSAIANGTRLHSRCWAAERDDSPQPAVIRARCFSAPGQFLHYQNIVELLRLIKIRGRKSLKRPRPQMAHCDPCRTISPPNDRRLYHVLPTLAGLVQSRKARGRIVYIENLQRRIELNLNNARGQFL